MLGIEDTELHLQRGSQSARPLSERKYFIRRYNQPTRNQKVVHEVFPFDRAFTEFPQCRIEVERDRKVEHIRREFPLRNPKHLPALHKQEDHVRLKQSKTEDIGLPVLPIIQRTNLQFLRDPERYERLVSRVRDTVCDFYTTNPKMKQSTNTLYKRVDTKPMLGKATETTSKSSTHSLYFKMKHFPRFQYVYNLVRDCKSRVEKFGKGKVLKEEMFQNVVIKIVIVGNFKEDNLKLLSKSAGKRGMSKGKHIWKVQPHICFENNFFSETSMKKNDLDQENICRKIIIKSDTFYKKGEEEEGSIIIVGKNTEKIQETITSCLEEPLHLMLQEWLEVLKTEGSSRLAMGLIDEIKAIKKQMEFCNTKGKSASPSLPRDVAKSFVPDDIKDYLFRRSDVYSFGIWGNSLLKVFVKKTDEERLRDELIKINPEFFEMFNLEIKKRKLEDKRTDVMHGKSILADVGNGDYHKGTLGGFVITSDVKRKPYALTCNHVFPEEGTQAFTENFDEIGTCLFTTREHSCDFAAIKIRESFSKKCDLTFQNEDQKNTNARVFSESLRNKGIVHKIGATTQVTKGIILSSEYYDKLLDDGNREHVFLVKGISENFSEEGDSGSLVFARSNDVHQTCVDVLGMVYGNKVTVNDDDDDDDDDDEQNQKKLNRSEIHVDEREDQNVDNSESSNPPPSNDDIHENISSCFRIQTALDLFKEKKGKDVKFIDDLPLHSREQSSESDDSN